MSGARWVGLAVLCGFVAALPGQATGTPIAHNAAERATYDGRVIPEPARSTDYLQFGANGAEAELANAFTELAKVYPRYVKLTTVAKELGDPNAVSTGPDGIPAGMPGDTKDGHPLYEIILTNTTVPDKGKQYVSLMFAHSAETCGREGELRAVEDLAKGAAEMSTKKYDDGKGVSGVTHSYTAAELLKRTKIFVSVTSPDGWAKGDNRGSYSQDNGAGLNSNRVAPQDGWSYAGDVLYRHGYTTATQSEGLAFTTYLRQVRMRELGGKPFAEGADMHGPIPFGYILLHDQGNTAIKAERTYDTGVRVKAAMDKVAEQYLTGAGATGYGAAASGAESVQKALVMAGVGVEQSPLDPRHLPLQWATVGQIWDMLSYTAGSTWGGWMNSRSGLDADSLSYEINCVSAGPWDPARMQMYVDNVRAILTTTIVRGAARAEKSDVKKVSLGGTLGYYDNGKRVTDRDGNPTPPPANFPNRPLLKQIKQVHYNVSQTDWFRQLRKGVVATPVRRVRPAGLKKSLGKVRTLVVADQKPRATKTLRAFAARGGNLVLTDRALGLLPALGFGTAKDVAKAYGYVGYGDLNLSDPLTEGITKYSRQTYDPIGLGYPTLMERDTYYGCRSGDDVCPTQKDSGTKNSAPIWSVARTVVEKVDGSRIVATVDPPPDRKSKAEGAGTDRVEIAVLPLGKGRVVIFGAALPRPTERYPHWFGINAQTLSHAAQTMLLRAMTWPAPKSGAARAAVRSANPLASLLRQPGWTGYDPFSGEYVSGP